MNFKSVKNLDIEKCKSYDVANYGKNLAMKLGLNDDSANTIYTCGLLHDIGKITIPKAILNKNGPLNNDEWDVMRTHVISGYLLLKNSKYKKASIVALTHHEKWNGTGYPFGSKKNDIPIETRIISIVDVFDALRSKRVYKEAWELDRVVEYMIKGRGTHFDPDILDVFFKKLPWS